MTATLRFTAPLPPPGPRSPPAPVRGRAQRVVQLGFTPFARPDRYASMTMFGPLTDHAVRTILTRLQLRPEDIRVRGTALGDVALLAKVAADAEPQCEPGSVQPFAFVEGLSKAELCEALAQLAADGWRPGPPVLSFVAELGLPS